MVRHKRFILAGIFVIVAGLASFAVLPQLSGFEGSLQAMRGANTGLMILALISTLLAPVFSGAVYVLLARRRLSLFVTSLIQYSGLFVNRVLPAGSGGIALNIMYLKRKGHTLSEATILSGINNTVGFIGHGLLLIGFTAHLLLTGSQLRLPLQIDPTLIIAITAGVIVLSITARLYMRRVLDGFIRQLRLTIVRLSHRRGRLLTAVSISMVLTMSNVISFWLCCRALDLPVSIGLAFFIFSIAVLFGSVVPTPGGLGAIEAALLGGLIASGVASPLALSAALLYRLVSYWIGIPVGLVSLVAIRSHITLQS